MLVRSLRATVRAPAARLRRGLLAPGYDRYVKLPSHEGPDFDAILVGAGYAMFGSPEGPWNMSRRAELKLGPRLKVHAVIDPDEKRSRAALATILPSIAAYAERVKSGKAKPPKAIFVACPPQYRGGLQTGLNDLEVQINKHFPDAGIMLEKPVATGLPWAESVGNAHDVGKILETRQNGVVSIGYCLRYLAAVQEMKRIIEEKGLHVMATFGRYIMAYELAIKQDWWRTSGSQGPVIENGTHLCDLSRYFGGDVEIDSIVAHAVEADEKPGILNKINFDNEAIPMEDRIPRVTSASWKYTNGAVGALLHGTILHGVDYSIELEVYCDGYQLILQDPYGTPSIAIRRPGSDELIVHPTPGDDPYTTEVSNFIDAIEGGPNPQILSTYQDAAKTYEFTWAVRRASEAMTRQRRSRSCGETQTRGEGGTGMDDVRMGHGV